MTDRSDPPRNPFAPPRTDRSVDIQEPRSDDTPRYATFLRRAAAFAIDSAVIFLVVRGIIAFLLLEIVRPYARPIEAVVPPFRLGAVIALVVMLGYHALLESSAWQGTLGKRIVSIKVTDLAGNRLSIGRAIGRHLAKQILPMMALAIGSFIPGMVGVALTTSPQEYGLPGYLIQPFTRQRQAIHDLIAGTLVVRR